MFTAETPAPNKAPYATPAPQARYKIIANTAETVLFQATIRTTKRLKSTSLPGSARRSTLIKHPLSVGGVES